MNKKILAVSTIATQTLVTGTAFAQRATTPTVNITVAPETTDPIQSVVDLITKFGGWLLFVAGALAVVFMIIGGIRYLVSAGNSTQAEAAKKTILYALGGLIVILISAFAVSLIMNLFTV